MTAAQGEAFQPSSLAEASTEGLLSLFPDDEISTLEPRRGLDDGEGAA